MPTMTTIPFLNQHSSQPNSNGPFAHGTSKINGPSSLELGGAEDHNSKPGGYSITCILFTGLIAVIAVFVLIACLVNSVHRVNEGNVGVYFRSGALLDSLAGPGLHTALPFITTMMEVVVRPETTYLDPLTCTTSDGVTNIFRNVQVICSVDQSKLRYLITNYGNDMKKVLVYDRVAEAVQAFCANSSIDEVYNSKFLEIEGFVKEMVTEKIKVLADEAITVLNLFIPKPDIPPMIAQNYREVKIEWTKKLVAEEKKKIEKIKKETEIQTALLEAEKAKQVSEILTMQEIKRAEGLDKIADIDNERRRKIGQTDSDISTFTALSDAAVNKELLTDQFIKLQLTKALMNNTKMYFSGQDSAVGGLINTVLGGVFSGN